MRASRAVLGAALICLAAGTALGSTVLGLSIEDQARLSSYIVVGEVIAQQGIDHPQNGLETQVTLLAGSVFKGALKPGQTLVFHTRGGELNGEISLAEGEAVFHTGQKVLVFVEEVDGRLYNLGLSLGVWDVHEESGGRITFARALQDGLEIYGESRIEMGPVSRDEMASLVAWSLRNPVFDNPLLREALTRGR
jgi:hypothetical protein